MLFALLLGAAVFALEWARVEIWRPELTLCTIALLAIVVSLGACVLAGGWKLARAELFPHLFFLSAIPWPPRFEQPITSGLMRTVATLTAELLHWLGIEAQTSGAAIALNGGLVGITEACSGIRSLQAGIMFGLAIGEWFLLTPLRRVLLLMLAIALAVLTNLARTVALCLQAEWHGVASVERVHDTIGNIVITALVLAIWFAGKLLVRQHAPVSNIELAALWHRVASAFVARTPEPRFAAVFACAVAGLLAARSLHAVAEARDHTLTVPLFSVSANAGSGNRLIPVPREIWNELRPASGEYVRREAPELPGGSADCYHFFWKPSPWNRFLLVHRPDICMPGIGWRAIGNPEPVDVAIDGATVHCYAFRFERGNVHALQLWGVWRNGEPVSLDYDAAQVLGAAPAPAALQLEGKRRSATEIISCSLIAEDAPLMVPAARALMQSVFHYQKPAAP